jgi:hypothetical protein
MFESLDIRFKYWCMGVTIYELPWDRMVLHIVLPIFQATMQVWYLNMLKHIFRQSYNCFHSLGLSRAIHFHPFL